MKLICLVKYVPDVDSFTVDYESSTLIRENMRLRLNPDDVCAVAFALRIKAARKDTSIEAVTMAPATVTPQLEDLLRIGVDQATLISDRLYAGSDTFATATILARYLSQKTFDVILTGTNAVDGDTSHIPAQLGACLELNQMSGIIRIDESGFGPSAAKFDVETDEEITTYQMALPAILSLTRDSKYKLPFPSRQALASDVSGQLKVISNQELALTAEEAGAGGSKTRVVKTFTQEYNQKGHVVVKADDAGADYVCRFLKDKGFI